MKRYALDTSALLTLRDDEAIVFQEIRERPGEVDVIFNDEHSSAIITHCK